MSHTELIEYPSAAKAREALVRMHGNSEIERIELIGDNRVLRVTFAMEPLDDNEIVVGVFNADGAVEVAVENKDETHVVTENTLTEVAPGTELTANENGDLTLPDGTVYDGPVTESAPGTEPLVTTAVEVEAPTDSSSPSPDAAPAAPVAEPEQVPNTAGLEENDDDDDEIDDLIGTVPEPDETITEHTTRDELRDLVEKHNLDVVIPTAGPLKHLRDAVKAALDEKKD